MEEHSLRPRKAESAIVTNGLIQEKAVSYVYGDKIYLLFFSMGVWPFIQVLKFS